MAHAVHLANRIANRKLDPPAVHRLAPIHSAARLMRLQRRLEHDLDDEMLETAELMAREVALTAQQRQARARSEAHRRSASKLAANLGAEWAAHEEWAEVRQRSCLER